MTTVRLTCISLFVLAALYNATSIVSIGGAPDVFALVLELLWSCGPFACLVILTIVARADPVSTWAIAAIGVPLVAYDLIAYWNAYWLVRSIFEGRVFTVGLPFGGHVLGFGLRSSGLQSALLLSFSSSVD